MSRLRISGILLASAFGIFIFYRLFVMYQMMHASFPVPPIVISEGKVTKKDIPRYLPAVGTLKSAQSVMISAETSGRISKVLFQSGQEVKEDELLVQLEDQIEQADLLRYQASLELAKINLGRTSTLTSQKVQSLANLDQKAADCKEAEALVNQSRAKIRQKQIRAPFVGILGINQVDTGQYLQAGNSIVTLTNLDTLRINFTRPEQDLPLLALGQEVLFHVDAWPDKEFKAKITSIDPQVREDTRVIEVQATFENPDKLLRPGMFADLKVILPSRGGMLVVPETSLDYSIYGTSVYVLTPRKDEKTKKDILVSERRYVDVGTRFRGVAEILKGLQDGERVATSGLMKLDNGSVVLVNNKPELKEKKSYTY